MTRFPFLAIAAALVLVALVLEARRARDITPTSDTAVIESYALLAASGDLDVGAYSRYQWHHPGPLSFYLLVPFHQLAGTKTAALYAGAIAINLLSAAAILVVLWRRVDPLAVFAMSAALALFAWRSAEAMASPWNPHIAVLPFAALVVMAAAAVSGSPWLLPLVALSASLAAQSHVALLPSAAILGVGAVAWLLVTERNIRALAWTAIVLAAVWALPAREELTGAPGNITLLWRYFVAEPRAGQPFGIALSAWADMLTGVLRPDFCVAHGWKYVESPVKWAEALSLAELAGLAAVAAHGWRTRGTFTPALAATLLAASALALWSAARAEEPLFDHAVFWIAGIGVLNVGVLTGEGLRLAFTAAGRHPPRRTLAVAAAAGFAVTLGAAYLELKRQVALSLEAGGPKETAAALADDIAPYLRAHGITRPVVRLDQDAWEVAAGVVLALQKRDVPVAIEDDWVVMFSPAFADTGDERFSVAIVAPAEHLRLAGVPGNEVISSHGPVHAHLIRLRP